MKFIPFYTLIYRECYRFLRLFRQTVIPPVLSTLLFILIFGYSLGRSIKDIEGFDYIVYILPGLAQMGVIFHAFQNSATSLFMARMERSIENFLVAPLGYIQIVMSYVFGSVMRGLTVGIATLAVSAFFVDFPMPHMGWLLVSWTLTAALFGTIGVISALLAESWDHIALFGNFVLMPLVYLGGTFYSINMLPPFWRNVSYFNPVFYAIDTTRWAIIGKSDVIWYNSFLITLAMVLVLMSICVLMFRKGFKLIN